jgi:methylated-DNA-[protein]-cysteine S-methyltransferase
MTQDELIQETLDQLYAVGPTAEELAAVVDRLHSSVTEWDQTIWYGSLPDTEVGPLLIAASRNGLVSIEFGQDERGFVRRLAKAIKSPVLKSQERVQAIAAQIDQYLEGSRQAFDLEVDLSALTPFQRRVLEAAGGVPAGVVATYGEIAQRIGKPRAARAVGQALARNPIPIVVPCHRVVASDGSLTGYSGRGGIETKAWLLKHEGAALA